MAVPCYNEAENIAPLARAFAETAARCGGALRFEVHWIDDASTDETAARIAELKSRGGVEFTSERHPHNLGLAGGLRTAFRRFARRCAEEEAIVACGLLDGDNSHHPGHFPGMLEV
ncbi:MAG: glycosyltransferase, partial [Terrimicrobiaceae bacterium]|nr:glycosyltransferase [Terrimicrobiaceae bacterium]